MNAITSFFDKPFGVTAMDARSNVSRPFRKGEARLVIACVAAVACFVLAVSMANAQQGPSTATEGTKHPSFLDSLGRWFDEQAANINSTFKNAEKKIENFNQDAGTVAKSAARGAKDAADAVAHLPNSRLLTGHEKCRLAPNGAPDCFAAAETICKAQGFGSGKSLDMTTAETCPPRVYISGHSSGPECKTETFVSRALCQ